MPGRDAAISASTPRSPASGSLIVSPPRVASPPVSPSIDANGRRRAGLTGAGATSAGDVVASRTTSSPASVVLGVSPSTLLRLRDGDPSAGSGVVRDSLSPLSRSADGVSAAPFFKGAGSFHCSSGHLSRQCSMRISPASKTTDASFPDSVAALWSSSPRLTAMMAALYFSRNPTSIAVEPMSDELVRTRTFRIWCLSRSARRTEAGVSLALMTSCMAIVPAPPSPSYEDHAASLEELRRVSDAPASGSPADPAGPPGASPYFDPRLRKTPPACMLNDDRRLRTCFPRRDRIPPPSLSGPVLCPPASESSPRGEASPVTSWSI